jgi:hypothetical protein
VGSAEGPLTLALEAVQAGKRLGVADVMVDELVMKLSATWIHRSHE